MENHSSALEPRKEMSPGPWPAVPGMTPACHQASHRESVRPIPQDVWPFAPQAPDTPLAFPPAPMTSPPVAPLRAWQHDALASLATWPAAAPFLISAAPGAGKTRPALELARRLLNERAITSVAVLCPTTPLTRQWATAAAVLGIQLAPDPEQPTPPRGFHGVAATYARIAANPTPWAKATRPTTLVIADEAHHLGEDLAWGTAFQRAFAPSPRWLLLSGTPFRSDATPIPGVRYDADGLAEPDISYTYAQAVNDGICRPVAFVTFDGSLSWRSGDDVIESSFETVLTPREAGRRYRTAISTELPDGLPRILREADAKLQALRRGTAGAHPGADDSHGSADGHADAHHAGAHPQAPHRDAAGLVVAADAAHARKIARLLHEATGKAPVVVLHTEAKAAQKLQAFTVARDPWIVAVNMVSEGVDIPRLRVGVYATAAKTPLVFRQIVGRFVRTIRGRAPEPSWLYLPADPLLRRHASEVESELRQALRRPEEQDDGLDDIERAARRRSEPSPAADFVPLSAEVAPQMTLFGSAPRVTPSAPLSAMAGAVGAPLAPGAPPAPDAPYAPHAHSGTTHTPYAPDAPLAHGAPHASGTPPPPGQTPPMPAFERRAHLRTERSRLVADLHRRDKRSHREINAWLNRETGVRRVEDATIAQLERSVTLLVRELTRRGRAA